MTAIKIWPIEETPDNLAELVPSDQAIGWVVYFPPELVEFAELQPSWLLNTDVIGEPLTRELPDGGLLYFGRAEGKEL